MTLHSEVKQQGANIFLFSHCCYHGESKGYYSTVDNIAKARMR